MAAKTEKWVVQYLKGKYEVHEEHKTENSASRRARSLGSRVIKVYRRDIWIEEAPFVE